MEALSDQSRDRGTGASLLSAAIVRGGLGLLGARDAEALGADVNEGFDGARGTDLERTRVGVDALYEHLDVDQAGRLGGVMQAVWTASGGSAATFPSDSPRISSTFDSEALAFLLQFEDSDDADFWARVSRGADLDLIVAAATAEEAWPGLQKLMRASVGRLTGKVCVVREDGYSSNIALQWQVRDGGLVLIGSGVSAWLAGRLSNIDVPTVRRDGVSIGEFLSRAQRAPVAISEFKATNGSNSVTYGSNAQADITNDADARTLALALGGNVGITRAVARVRDSHQVDVNFEKLTASGRTNAQISLSELAWTAVNLLVDTKPAYRRDLDSILARSDISALD